MVPESAKPITALLPVDTKTSFPVTDGRELSLGRGEGRCSVSFRIAERHRYPDESDWLLARLDLADCEGRVFRLERRLSASVLLELIRTARHHHPGEPELILPKIHCAFDHRSYIATATVLDERVVALGYHTKYFMADLDLLTYRADRLGYDQLVVRVPALEGSGLSGPTPPVSISTDWAAKIIVWPSLLVEAREPVGEQPMFAATAERSEPQATVTVT